MEYVKIGRTDIEVSRIALGCWQLISDNTWGEQDEAQSIATVRAAMDAGVNFFDTAEMYGNGSSEALLGKALADCRRDVVIATKYSSENARPEKIKAACEASLRRLKTDYIDLYQIHWPSREVPIADQLEMLDRLKQEGKILAIGVCNFAVEDLSDLLSVGRCETDQLPYSLLWRAIEFGIREKCVEEGIDILPYSPLSQGLLTGKFKSADEVPEGRARTRLFSSERPMARHSEGGCEKEVFEALDRIRAICAEVGEPMARVSLAWLLHQPGVTSVVAGARSPEQVRENARAADLELAEDVVRRLSEATEPVKEKIGSNPDMWQTESRMR